MNLSQHLEGIITDWVRGTAFPARPTSIRLALSSTSFGDTGAGGLEPSTLLGYARQDIEFGSPAQFVLGDGASIFSSEDITFGPVTGSNWAPVSHAGFFDQNNNLLFWGPLNEQRVVPVGDTITIKAGDIQLKLGPHFGSYFADIIFDWLQNIGTAAAPTSTWLHLSTTDPKEDLSGDVPVDNTFNYTRQQIVFDPADFESGVGTTISQTAPIVFGPATVADWPALTHAYVSDDNDFELFVGALALPRTLAVGDSLAVPAGSINLLVR